MAVATGRAVDVHRGSADLAPARLCFLIEARPDLVGAGPVIDETRTILGRRGFQTDLLVPERDVPPIEPTRASSTLYLLKSDTELSLILAERLAAAGASVLNPTRGCSLVKDKLQVARLLWAAGIPAPRTWAIPGPERIATILKRLPVIVKPRRGFHGRGVRMISNRADLDRLNHAHEPLLVQEHIEGPGEDLNVYVIGRHCYATRRPFTPDSFLKAGRPCSVGRAVRSMALRIGRLFGLGLYGLDVIESRRGPVVVDVNYFPGYKGVPNAASLLADYISDYARGRRSLRAARPGISSGGRR